MSCLIQSIYLLLCVLSIFIDLEPLDGTSEQQAAHPDEMTTDSTLPLTTVPVCSGECNVSIDVPDDK